MVVVAGMKAEVEVKWPVPQGLKIGLRLKTSATQKAQF